MRRTLAVAVICATALALSPSPASADPTYQLAFTGGLGAYPRSAPTLESRTGAAIPEGSFIAGVCWQYGEAVASPSGYTSDVWVRDDAGLFWPEAWLDTGRYGIPPDVGDCAATDASVPSANLEYSRSTAVNYALAHATDVPENWGLVPGCTWFVSHALWAGGMPQDESWNSTDPNGPLGGLMDGSDAAWAAQNLRDHLVANKDVAEFSLDLAANAVPQAELGDVIAYDWEGDGRFDHLALVTGIDSGHYPLVSEWGTGEWWDRNAVSYQSRGWTWSEKSGTWLQTTNPNMSATLIHVNGGVFLPGF